MRTKMVEQSNLWLIESPVNMVEGEQIAFSVDWQGAASVSDPDVVVFKNGVDITDQVLISSDSHVVSGVVLTLRKITARNTDGGARYVVVIQATVDGNKEKRKLLIRVARAAAEG